MPITNVRSPHAKRRADPRRRGHGRVAPTARPDGSRALTAGSTGSRHGIAEVGVVDEAARTAPTRYSEPATTTGPGRARRAPGPRAARGVRLDRTIRPGPGRRDQAAASAVGGSARGRSRAVQMIRASRSAAEPCERPHDAVDVLVGHRRRDERDRRPAARRRRRGTGRRSSRATARAAAPAGLWAPSSRTSRPSAATSSSSRPGQRAAGVAAASGVRRRPVAIPAASSASSVAIGDGDVRRLVAAAQADAPSARARAARRAARRGPSRGSAPAPTSVSGTPRRAARRRTTASAVAGRARHGEVAALDDRRLLAGDR